MLLEVSHRTRYDYGAPVALAQHRAHLRPLADAHQQLLAFDLDIEPPPSHSREGRDYHGNLERHFSIAVTHRRLQVRSTSRLALQARFAALEPEGGPPWEQVAMSLRYVARARFDPVVEFCQPSPYVPRLSPLAAYARASFSPGRPVAAAAIDLMRRIHADFRYETASTAVDTPMAVVWASRRGVCQDFAHLMAGCLRLLGLPARYVSGYMLTHAPEGGAAMTGADASHAWVQAWCPGTPGVPADGWLDLDPTNAIVPGSGHVRLAVGRDYGDVAPLRGVIRGGGRHVLEVGVDTRRVDIAPEPGAALATLPFADPGASSESP